MRAYINYIIDDSCTIQDVYGNIIYGVLCESENGVSGFQVHPACGDRKFTEYFTNRNASFYNLMDRTTYGKPTDISFRSRDRNVYTLFLEYTGNVYITAYEMRPGGTPKPVMVKCTDDISLGFPDELKRNHNIRRFIEAKNLKDKALQGEKNQSDHQAML